MLYIIDGYNFLFRFRAEHKELEKNRAETISTIDSLCSKYSIKALLIFDSQLPHSQDYPNKQQLYSLDVVFSPTGTSADDYILEYIDGCKTPQQITVVSSDQFLCDCCKAKFSKTISIEDFMEKFKRKELREQRIEHKPTKENSHEFQRLLDIFEKRFKAK